MTARYCTRHPSEALLVLSGACLACDRAAWGAELADRWRARRNLPPKCRVHGTELMTATGACAECEPA